MADKKTYTVDVSSVYSVDEKTMNDINSGKINAGGWLIEQVNRGYVQIVDFIPEDYYKTVSQVTKEAEER